MMPVDVWPLDFWTFAFTATGSAAALIILAWVLLEYGRSIVNWIFTTFTSEGD